MTKKSLTKTSRASRPVSSPKKYARWLPPPSSPRDYPFDRRYAALDTGEVHPIDAIVRAIPKIAAIDRRVARLSRRRRLRGHDRRSHVEYEDLRLLQRVLRQEVFFDAGHNEGRLAGIMECFAATNVVNAAARAFARQISIAAMSTKLRPERITAILLELAHARVLGVTPVETRRAPRKQRKTGNA